MTQAIEAKDLSCFVKLCRCVRSESSEERAKLEDGQYICKTQWFMRKNLQNNSFDSKRNVSFIWSYILSNAPFDLMTFVFLSWIGETNERWRVCEGLELKKNKNKNK